MTKNTNTRGNFDETFFMSRENNLAHQEEAGQSLQMSASQKTARLKRHRLESDLLSAHTLILNRGDGFVPSCFCAGADHAHLRIHLSGLPS